MSRSKVANRSIRRPRLRPVVQGLESRLLLTGGRLDASFGGGTGYSVGNVTVGGTGGITAANLVQVESDNSIIAAVESSPTNLSTINQVGLVHLSASGTIDASFGTGGQAVVTLPSVPGGLTIGGPSSLLLQPDGKILVVAPGSTSTDRYEVVARFDANGQPDSTFGTSGVEVVDLTTLGLTQGSLPDAALQANGSIVLAGSNDPTTNGQTTGGQIVAIELEANGTLNTSFGTSGEVSIPALTAIQPGTDGRHSVEGVVIQPDGQIIILSTIVYDFLNPPVSSSQLIRLNADGTIDTTIKQGLSSTSLTVPQQLVQQPNGQLLVLGETAPASPGLTFTGPPVVARLNADGTLASTATLPPTQTITLFGVTGSEATASAIALQPNGDVVLIGSGFLPANQPSNTAQVVRLTPNLTPDRTFGIGGVSNLVVSLQGEAAIMAKGLAVGPNNQVVLIGAGATSSSAGSPIITDYAIARLTATGAAVPGDYTGDGISDLAVYLPASGSFAIRPSSGGPDQIIPFGIPGAGQTIPAPGDYTGSGKTEIAAYLPSQGIYAYRPSNGGPDVLQSFGIAGPGQSIPAPGDYFGTGQDDIAVYMPSLGAFGIRNPNGGPDQIIPFGIAGMGQSIPAPGDYFGTGQTDLAVYLPSIGAFAIRNPSGGPDQIIPFGIPGAGNSIPIPGDYDGSGKTELAVYFPKLGEFAYRPANGGPDVIEAFGAANDGSLPVPGDYSGSGKTEIAVYDPNYADFAYRPANGGPDVIESFGTPGPGATIPTATPAGALPGSNEAVSKSSVVSTLSLTVPSGPSTSLKRVNRLVVNQGGPNSKNLLG